MKNINLNRLFYFHTFVQKKNVVEAAKELYISQPALSSQLKQIEKDLGLTLFDRSSRNLDLTEKGQHLFYFTRRIFETCENMLDELDPSQKPVSINYKIGISDQIERPFCLQFISKLFQSRQQNDIQKLNVVSSSDDILLNRLRAGDLNFILTLDAIEDEFIVPISSKILPIILALPKSYRGQRTPAISADCLKAVASRELNLVMPASKLKLRYETDVFFAKNEISPQVVFETDILAMMIRAISDGIGAGFVPYPYVVNELKSDRIKIAGLPNGYWREKLWLIANRKAFSNQTLEEINSIFENSL